MTIIRGVAKRDRLTVYFETEAELLEKKVVKCNGVKYKCDSYSKQRTNGYIATYCKVDKK